MPRYLVQRTLPTGAVDGLTNEALKSNQANNAAYDVKWIHSYVNRDKTKTFCIYEGPHETAIREANARNNLPIDEIYEIPADLVPV